MNIQKFLYCLIEMQFLFGNLKKMSNSCNYLQVSLNNLFLSCIGNLLQPHIEKDLVNFQMKQFQLTLVMMSIEIAFSCGSCGDSFYRKSLYNWSEYFFKFRKFRWFKKMYQGFSPGILIHV